MKHDNRYVWFDLARGLSALLVCAGHLRAAMFVDYSTIHSTASIDRAFYFFTGLGHQAVMVFFVLSGFFVGGSVLARGNAFRFGDYLTARLTRLWVVLIPALIFTLIIDHAISLVAPSILSGDFNTILNSGPTGDRPYSSSIGTFVANAFFLQTIYSPVFGTNGPLWSLANEFWYYFIFPLTLIAFNRSIPTSPLIRALSATLVVLIVIFVARNMMSGFLIWLFGVAIYLIYKKYNIKTSIWFSLFSTFMFIGSLVDSKFQFVTNAVGIQNDIIVGVCFSLLLISINDKYIRFGQLKIAKISKYLSEISYTLYLVHFPIVLLAFGSFYKDRQLELNLASIVQYFSWIFLILLVSIITWWLFERNTPVVRQYIKMLLTKASSRRAKSARG